MPGRRWSEGSLQSAIEAKEGVKIHGKSQRNSASTTFSELLFGCMKSCQAMTGYARPEGVEFAMIYGLECWWSFAQQTDQCTDYNDLVYLDGKEEKIPAHYRRN